jgi:hypothetical protein
MAALFAPGFAAPETAGHVADETVQVLMAAVMVVSHVYSKCY